MATTTAEIVRFQDSHRDERALNEYIEWFFKNWSPEDPSDKHAFHRDFIAVVSAIHRDASRPFGEMLKNAMMAMPAQSFIKSPA